MTNRQAAHRIQTDRPASYLAPAPLTVLDMLGLEPMRAGSPQVVAGYGALSRTVRWVHVAESPNAASFLSGGELVLTTGTAWPEDKEPAAQIEAMVDAGAVGFVIELGSRFVQVPETVRQVCKRRGVPLIALHEEVRFVAITEAAHRLLVSAQVTALQARDDVQALFTELNRAGAPADLIVAEVARLAGGPVVLEDLAHRVVCCAPYDRSDSEVLHDWARCSRSRGWDGAEHRVVEVAARGHRWGRLVAVRVPSQMPDSAIDLVLTQGALALSLGAMVASTEHGTSWTAVRQRRALEAVLQRRYTSAEHLVQVLESAGLQVRTGPVTALGWTIARGSGTEDPNWVDRTRETADRVAGRLRMQLVCGPVFTVPGGMLALLVLPSTTEEAGITGLIGQFVDLLRSGPLPVDVVTASRAVMSAGHATEQLLDALAEARDLLETAQPGTHEVLRSRGSEIEQLTRAVPTAQLQSFVENLIGPLLAYDARHGTDLVTVLACYLRHPGNRTQAARESHLSRSVFYQRLQLIESQLNVELHDGSTLAALHVAVTAHHRMTNPPAG